MKSQEHTHQSSIWREIDDDKIAVLEGIINKFAQSQDEHPDQLVEAAATIDQCINAIMMPSLFHFHY